MPKTGTADLPLHYGQAPRWLFQRMTLLAREITLAVATEFGVPEMLRRLADPFWFQSFGCVLGFDWHSSGLTTTVCGALKVGLQQAEGELGLYVAGGKGATSRKTPQEIEARGADLAVDPAKLVYASRMSAKVDNTALQDGYQIYHHAFIFDRQGHWCVVQQGMNGQNHQARRYHWSSEGLQSMVVEPHSAICCDETTEVLDLTARESEAARTMNATLARQEPTQLMRELQRLQKLELPGRHGIELADIHPQRISKILLSTYERQPEGFEQLLGIQGIGPKSMRALTLISELVYGAQASTRDPARFSFTHGGKDGIPYPVDRTNYDRSTEILRRAIEQAQLGHRDKLDAIKRLTHWEQETASGRLPCQAPAE